MSTQPVERKVALVTGASRGIGRATAVELARRGYDLVLNYLRNTEEARQTLRLVEAEGAQGWLVPANVGEPEEIKALFKEVAEHQPLEVIVHNAALGTFKDLFQIRPNQLELAFRVNVFALLWLAKAALPLLKERGGKIITVSSLGSQRVVPYYGIVGPSKAALEAMVRYLALELKPLGITVNAVSGGLIDTDALPRLSGLAKHGARSRRSHSGWSVGSARRHRTRDRLPDGGEHGLGLRVRSFRPMEDVRSYDYPANQSL